MKIYKNPEKLVFDTESPENIEYQDFRLTGLIPLHQFRNPTMYDLDFLEQYFPENHRIFRDFGSSYYYVKPRSYEEDNIKKLHELKTINPFFEDIWRGLKDFEVRKNDRNFEIGDRLKLIEYGANQIPTPRYILKDVKYILMGGQYGISDDYVVLGLKDVREGNVIIAHSNLN